MTVLKTSMRNFLAHKGRMALSAVAVLLYENTWAGPFVSALRRQDAEVVASGRIPADQVAAALDALEKEN